MTTNCKKMDFCHRLHASNLVIHLEELCPELYYRFRDSKDADHSTCRQVENPENYSELKKAKICESCYRLLDIPNCNQSLCNRTHKSCHWNQTPHSSKWYPEQVSSNFCKC